MDLAACRASSYTNAGVVIIFIVSIFQLNEKHWCYLNLNIQSRENRYSYGTCVCCGSSLFLPLSFFWSICEMNHIICLNNLMLQVRTLLFEPQSFIFQVLLTFTKKKETSISKWEGHYLSIKRALSLRGIRSEPCGLLYK